MISSRLAVGAVLALTGAGFASAQVIERDFSPGDPDFIYSATAPATFIGDDFVIDLGGGPKEIESLTLWVVQTGNTFVASDYTLWLGGDLTTGGVTSFGNTGVGSLASFTSNGSNVYALTFSLGLGVTDPSYFSFGLSGSSVVLLGDELSADDAIDFGGDYVWGFDATGAVVDVDATRTSVNFSATFQAVPEPSTYAAFGAAGLIGLVAFRRFRAKKA